MKQFAEEIAERIIEHIGVELHQVMVERIIELAAEKWRYQFVGDQTITRLIEEGVDRAIEEKYKPALDYIADGKARKSLMRRAAKQGIPAAEIMQLFPPAK